MCIAEGPGRDEDRTGTPLVGASGKLLRSTIAEICAYLGVDASSVWYTNTVRCRPPDNRTPTQQEVDACLPWLQEEVDEVKPVCILALGRTAQGATTKLDLTRIYDGNIPVVVSSKYDGNRETQVVEKNTSRDNQKEQSSEQSSQSRMVPGFERQQTLYGLQDSLPVLHNAMGSYRSEDLEQEVQSSSTYGIEQRSNIERTRELRTSLRELSCETNVGESAEIMVIATQHPAYILRRRSKLDDWKGDVEDAIRFAFKLPVRAGGPYDDSDYLVGDKDTPTLDEQFIWGEPDPNAKYLAADTEFDDLEEHVGTKAVGYSVSDGTSAIFSTDTPRNYPHLLVHRADADLDNLGVDADNLDSYDDTLLQAYPLQQKFGWPYLGLKRTDGKGLAQIVCDPPIRWKIGIKELLQERVETTKPAKWGSVFDQSDKNPVNPWRLRVVRKGFKGTNWNFKTKEEALQKQDDLSIEWGPKPGKQTFKTVKIPFSAAYHKRPEVCGDYGATDAYGTSKLGEALDKLLDQEPWAREYYETIEKPLIPVLLQMEKTGIKIDVKTLNAAGNVIDEKRAETEAKLKLIPEFTGINLASTQQLGPILLDMGIVDGKLTETGKIGVAEDNILRAFGVEDASLLPLDTDEGRIAATILSWREMGTYRTKYVDGIINRLDPENRIHPRFNSAGTYTNRLSSSDPNAQNIPARTQIGMAIRGAFVAPRGYALVGGDESQIQLRGFGEMTHAQIFIDAYVNGYLRGCPQLCKCSICDVHQRFTDLAHEMGYPYVERSSHTGGPSMKNGVFAVTYGVEARKLAQTIGIPVAEAGKFIDQMKKAVPEIITWPQIASAELSSKGYVETLLGWRMFFPDYGSVVDKWHKEAIRQAACGKVQGTEAGIVKASLIEVYRSLKKYFPAYRMVLTVHDEWLAEGPIGQAEEVRCMQKEIAETVPKKWMRQIPIVFDARIVTNWAQMKE